MAANARVTGTRARGIPDGVLGAAFVVLWCTGYPAAKIGLAHCAPFTLLDVRFACAALLYGALALIARAAWPRGRAALHGVAIGTLQLALQFGGAYLAVALGVNVGILALVIGTMPILTALIGVAFGEPIRPLQWLGFGFGFGGVALAVGQGLGPDSGAGWPAYLAVLCSLLGICAGTVYQKRVGSQVDLRSGLSLQHVVATVLLLPLAAHEGLRCDTTPTLFATLAWLVVINSMGGFALFYLLLQRGAVNQVAALFFLMPPVTAVMDYVVLGDRLTGLKVAGILVAALGVYLATRPPTHTVSVPSAAAPRSPRAPGG